MGLCLAKQIQNRHRRLAALHLESVRNALAGCKAAQQDSRQHLLVLARLSWVYRASSLIPCLKWTQGLMKDGMVVWGEHRSRSERREARWICCLDLAARCLKSRRAS